jgi:hypothetical protein
LNSRSWSHNPTPQPLGHGHIWRLGECSNLRLRLFRPALVRLSYTGKSGGDGENRTLIGWVQTSSPPVERRPHDCRTGCGGGNRTHLMAAYETAVRSSSSSPQQDDLVGRAGIEPATFRVSDGCTPLPCSRPMEPRAGIEPASPLYRSGASPAMLAGRKTWSRQSESNARRTSRRWRALPSVCSSIELHRRS